MPEGIILIYGADLLAPSLLFAILMWAGIARRLELSARRRSVMARPILREAPVQVVLSAAPGATGVRTRNAA